MSKAIFWFRRDLRIEDNVGLFHALKENDEVIPIFIFDKKILDDLKDKSDKRLIFIYDQLESINTYLKDKESSLVTYYDTPEKAFKKIIKEYQPEKVYTNEDYEPYAIKRDKEIKKLLEGNDIEFKSYKDQVIFAKDEIEKNDGGIYTVYTPYKKKWRKTLSDSDLDTYNTDKYSDNYCP